MDFCRRKKKKKLRHGLVLETDSNEITVCVESLPFK